MAGLNESKPVQHSEIKPGDIVKYKDELPDEIGTRYTVIWVDSPRAQIEYIPPEGNNNPWIGNSQHIRNLSDLEVVISG
jgi:hypothetical protein